MDMELFTRLFVWSIPISFVPFLFNRTFSRPLLPSLAAFAFLLGCLLATALVIGLGAGDTWVVYPPWVNWDAWLLPVGLWAFAVAVFSCVYRVPGCFRRIILHAAYVLMHFWIALAVIELVICVWAAFATDPAMASRGEIHRESPAIEKALSIGFAVFLVALGTVWLLLMRYFRRRIDGPSS
jgi:hypothetical protein